MLGYSGVLRPGLALSAEWLILRRYFVNVLLVGLGKYVKGCSCSLQTRIHHIVIYGAKRKIETDVHIKFIVCSQIASS